MTDALITYKKIIEPIVDREGFEVFDISVKRIKGTLYLQVFVDKHAGINLNEIEYLSYLISDELDFLGESLFGEPYTLLVSSPGAERPIENEGQMVTALGKYIRLEYFGHQYQRPFHEGILLNIYPDHLELEVQLGSKKKILDIDHSEIRSARHAVKV